MIYIMNVFNLVHFKSNHGRKWCNILTTVNTLTVFRPLEVFRLLKHFMVWWWSRVVCHRINSFDCVGFWLLPNEINTVTMMISQSIPQKSFKTSPGMAIFSLSDTFLRPGPVKHREEFAWVLDPPIQHLYTFNQWPLKESGTTPRSLHEWRPAVVI